MILQTNEAVSVKAPELSREQEVVAYLNQFEVSQAAPGGAELKTAICMCLANPALLLQPTKSLYPAIAEKFGIAKSTAINHIGILLVHAQNSSQSTPLFTLLGIAHERVTPAKFITRSVKYLQLCGRSFAVRRGSLRDLYLIAPESMSNREKFLYMYYFAANMIWTITGYLILPTNNRGDFNTDAVQEARACFIQGFAGVAARLLHSSDPEIVSGIKALTGDFQQGNIYGICADPSEFYQRIKAIAAMCRPYYYGLDDRVIAWHLLREHSSYPDMPERFCVNPLPRWLREAIGLCQFEPGDREIAACVQDSFPNDAARNIWRYSTIDKTSEYLDQRTLPGDEHSSFIVRVSPIMALPDYDIAAVLGREMKPNWAATDSPGFDKPCG